MRTTMAAAAFAIFGGMALHSAAHAQSTGSCVVRKTEVTAANSFDQTTSVTFVNLGTAGAITFTQASAGCVGGTFSAASQNVNAPADDVRLQVLLDGASCQPLTGNQGFSRFSSTYSTEYFCGANVPAGTHTVQVQYHSGSGGAAQIYQRILEVRHH